MPSNSEDEKQALDDRVFSGVPPPPMLATATASVPSAESFIFETKWDGYRCLAKVDDGKVDLYSRNGLSWKGRYPAIETQLATLPHQCLLDGEVVILDAEGKQDFQALQHYQDKPIKGLTYVVFDLLWFDGHVITHLGLEQRRQLLDQLVQESEHIKLSPQYTDGAALLERVRATSGEGIMAKKRGSRYLLDTRSAHWLKVKVKRTARAFVVGMQASPASSTFGSLVLAERTDEGWQFVGKVGTGFSESDKRGIAAQLLSYHDTAHPFAEDPQIQGPEILWLQPVVKADITYTEHTRSGRFRHPVFQRLVIDRPLTVIPSNAVSLNVEGEQVRVTNLHKVYWPDEGYTKYDLIDYYINMNEVMLPHLIGRPQSLNRNVNGLLDQGFYQKDSADIIPSWAEGVSLYSKTADKDITYLLCDAAPTLIYMANLGCIEVHPWLSRTAAIDEPDFSVIDLDPSSTSTFADVVEVALVVKEVLDLASLTAFAKTSGSKGIHIYILLAGIDFTFSRQLAELICIRVQQRIPTLSSLERMPDKRKGKIYLDYLQNARGKTIAAPYSVRPKPGATVSAPLQWEELTSQLDLRAFTMQTMPARVAELGDVMAGVLTTKNDLGEGLGLLASLG